MDLNVKLCDNCYARHKTNTADIWCPHCGEGFCTNCGECHNASKVGKFHETISIDDFQKMPHYLAEMKTYCSQHEKTFDLFCQEHGQCFCLSCLKESHNGCKNIASLSDIISNVKSSAAVDDIDSSLKNINDIFYKIKENRLENKCRLEEQKTEYLDRIQKIRVSINNHLDKLVNEVVDKISSEVENIQLCIDDILEKIQERSENIRKIQDNFTSVKQMTELQVFLGIKTFQDIIDNEIEYLAKLERDEKVNEMDVKFEISKSLSTFCDEMDSFGDVSVLQTQGSLCLNVSKRERAQYMLPKEITLANVKVGSKKKLTYPLRKNDNTSITGCTIMHDGSIIFADSGNGILVMGNGNDIYRDIITLRRLWDVAYVGSYKLVATLNELRQVAFIDLLLGSQTEVVDFDSNCYGIDCMNDKIAIRGDGIFMIADREGNIKSKFKAKCLSHVAISESKIYGTHYSNNCVMCYSTNGTGFLWKFEDELLQGPQDITVDGEGFAYIACETSNNVVVVSPDGKACKEILNKTDGLDSPFAIHYKKTLMKLLVCNRSKGAILCDMQCV